MSTVLDTITTPSPVDVVRSVADLLRDLGDIPPERVRLYPAPGTVTFEQFVEVNEQFPPTCEWVDNTMVEKTVGQHESWLAARIIMAMGGYFDQHNPGMIFGPDGVMRILPKIGRAPDVAVVLWSRLPEGKPLPRNNKVPAIVPDLAVEVLSESNTNREMQRKRREYFQAGTKLVWEIDPATRTARVYTTDDEGVPFDENGVLDGDPVLPGFQLSMKKLFAGTDADR